MPDDHSKLVPLLPIPNRTVKRLSADDSADSRVKVGHRQALMPELAQLNSIQLGVFFFRFDFRIDALNQALHMKVPSRQAAPLRANSSHSCSIHCETGSSGKNCLCMCSRYGVEIAHCAKA